MARQRRFDFRGGVCRSFSEDTKDFLEVSKAQNCRLGEVYGALTKRDSSQRIHTDELESGDHIDGIFQWDHATAKLVCICGGDLFYKTLAAATWTNKAGTLSTTNRTIFQQHVVAGTPTLYFANGEYCSWDGTTLTEAISGAPAATYIAYYKGRMFAVDGATKQIYWSKVADPATWADPDGGEASVGVYDAEPLVGLCPVGMSLLVFKEDSIARFTGTSQDSIRIDQETEGVSPDVGCIAPGTITRVENFVFFLSDRGPYLATEVGVTYIGTKVEPDMMSLDRDVRSKAWAVHNKRRAEVWLFVPEDGETTNTQFWIWSYRVGAWTGPHSFSGQFDASVACQYEDADGTESILVGGYDGYVRDADVELDILTVRNCKDDVHQDDTDTGSGIEIEVTLPELHWGEPSVLKIMTMVQTLRADLGATGSLTITTNSESQASETMTLSTKGSGVNTYPFRPALRGYAPTISLKDASAGVRINKTQINGFDLQASDGRTIV